MANKVEINPEYSRIKNRAFRQQDYRNRLAKNLKDDRKLGEIGKALAKDHLNKESQTLDYIIAKHGFTQQLIDKFNETWERRCVTKCLDKYKYLDLETAKILFEAKELRYIAENLDKIKGLNQEMAEKIFDMGYGDDVAINLDTLQGLDATFAQKLIEAGFADQVRKNVKSFKKNSRSFKISKVLKKIAEVLKYQKF